MILFYFFLIRLQLVLVFSVFFCSMINLNFVKNFINSSRLFWKLNSYSLCHAVKICFRQTNNLMIAIIFLEYLLQSYFPSRLALNSIPDKSSLTFFLLLLHVYRTDQHDKIEIISIKFFHRTIQIGNHSLSFLIFFYLRDEDVISSHSFDLIQFRAGNYCDGRSRHKSNPVYIYILI